MLMNMMSADNLSAMAKPRTALCREDNGNRASGPANAGAVLKPLTARERQILTLAAQGYSAKGIAQRCGIAPRTVECHLDTMRLKLRARNRTHMVAIAIRNDLLSQADLLTALCELA